MRLFYMQTKLNPHRWLKTTRMSFRDLPNFRMSFVHHQRPQQSPPSGETRTRGTNKSTIGKKREAIISTIRCSSKSGAVECTPSVRPSIGRPILSAQRLHSPYTTERFSVLLRLPLRISALACQSSLDQECIMLVEDPRWPQRGLNEMSEIGRWRTLRSSGLADERGHAVLVPSLVSCCIFAALARCTSNAGRQRRIG